MNLEQLIHWIRLVAQVVLEVVGRLDDLEMKPERIQIWIGIVARSVLYALDGVGGPGAEMKPERIQFWLRIAYRFVVAIFDAVNEETGKSGETTGDAGW